MIVYLNGNFVDAHQASISIWDAGFLYGEGIFTTLRLDNGMGLDLECHWKRLATQAAELAIPFSPSFQETQVIVANLVHKNQLGKCASRLRITLTRGGGMDYPLPISTTRGDASTILLTLTPLPKGFDDELAGGIKVITLGSEYARHCRPDLKSLNFLPSLLALREARHRLCQEAIMLDDEGLITEASLSSVFVIQSSIIITPRNNGRILAGCTRKIILDLASENRLTCREDDLDRKDLETAEEVFLCNSIRGIVPVISIDDQPVGQQLPGPVTMQIRRLYNQARHSA